MQLHLWVNYFFERHGDVTRDKIKLSDYDIRNMDRKFMMFYTGIRRSADDILAKQSEETHNKLSVLDFMRNQAIIDAELFSQQKGLMKVLLICLIKLEEEKNYYIWVLLMEKLI